MTARKTMQPWMRKLLDHVLTVDISDMSKDNIADKYTDLLQGIETAGFTKVADTLSYIAPAVKLGLYLKAQTVKNMTMHRLSKTITDVLEIVPVPRKNVKQFLENSARILEANSDNHQSAAQVFDQLNVTQNALMLVLADAVYTIRDFLVNWRDLDHVVPDMGHLLHDVRVPSLDPMADFIVDFPAMRKGLDRLGIDLRDLLTAYKMKPLGDLAADLPVIVKDKKRLFQDLGQLCVAYNYA